MLHCVYLAQEPGRPPGPGEAWLSAAETARARSFRHDKRRQDWLRGRRAAKEACALAARERWGGLPPLAQLQVDAAPSGAPFVRVAPEAAPLFGFAPGRRLPIAVSISHSAGTALCAAAAAEEVRGRLGVDLERVEPRAPSFAGDFLAGEEMAACAGGATDLRVTAVWSAKEAVLKALGLGLTVDTRAVVCIPGDVPAPARLSPPGAGWRVVTLLKAPAGYGAPSLFAWWRPRQGFVQTLVHGAGARRPWGDT